MPYLEPRGAGDDAELQMRFRTAPFPLLGVGGWRGERHLSSYGVAEPGETTIALELVHGPRQPSADAARIAVQVSTVRLPDLSAAPRAAAKRLDVAGTLVELRAVPLGDGWQGQAVWGPGFVTVTVSNVRDAFRLERDPDLASYGLRP